MNRLLRLSVGVLAFSALLAASAAPSLSDSGTAPVASFSVGGPSKGIVPLQVTFVNTTTGATSYSWNFGDKSALSSSSAPTHTYTKVGTYTATLTAKNSVGKSAAKATITVTPPMPVAAFSASSTGGAWPLKVTFKNKSKGASSYSWSFGDQTPSSTSSSPVHTYMATETFTVTLTAINASGSSQATATVTTITPKPTANFSASATSGYAPLAVTFTDKSIAATSYAWDFGDGTSSTYASNLHFFNNPGVYKVVQTVTNDKGSSAKSVTITVTPPPTDLKVTVTEDDWLAYGGIAYLQVTVANVGRIDATGVVLTLTLPSNKTFLEAQIDSGPDEVCTMVKNVATCPLDTISAYSESDLIEFAAALPVGSKASVSVKSNEPDANKKNNSASVTVKKLAY